MGTGQQGLTLGLALFQEVMIEDLDRWVVLDGTESCHVETTPEPGISSFAQAGTMQGLT